jgi:hypothetical protein
LERENTKTDGNWCLTKKNNVKKTNDETIVVQLLKNAHEKMPIVELIPIHAKEMGSESLS